MPTIEKPCPVHKMIDCNCDDARAQRLRINNDVVAKNAISASSHAADDHVVMQRLAGPVHRDPVNPSHYKGDLVMRIIELFGLNFRLGNVIKYILRHGEKAGLEDLKKSRWYLDREIAALEGKLTEGALK